MRILITGGTGLIGQALTKALAYDGHQVIILSRNPKQTEPLKGDVVFQKWDAQTGDGWAHWADGADAIVNLAGASIAGDGLLPTRWSVERKRLLINSRVKAGEAVVDAIRQVDNKPKVVIQSSAVGYYGTHDFSVELTEESPAGDDFLASICHEWEASTDAVEEMGVRRAITRLGVVLSLDGGALPSMEMPFKLYAGGRIGNGQQPFPWIHIYDVVRAIRFLINNPSMTGAFNLTAPQVMTNGDFAKLLGEAMGKPSFMPAPAFAFNLMFGEVATVLLEGQRVIPKKLLDMDFEFIYPTAKEALHALYHSKGELVTT